MEEDELNDIIDRLKKIRNEYIFEIIPSELLRILIRGYSSRLKAGIAIYYHDKDNKINAFQPEENDEELIKLFHPLCNYYRKKNKNECKKFDEDIYKMFNSHKWSKPKIYLCHKGLWDMAYPLYIDNVLYGVIYSGQIIIDDDLNIETLPEWIRSSIEINPLNLNCLNKFTNCINQHHEINRIIDLDEHIEIVEKKLKERNCSISEFIKTSEYFFEFGRKINELLNNEFKSKIDREFNNLNQESGKHFVNLSIDNQGNGLDYCLNFLDKCEKIGEFEIKNRIYTRKTKAYEILPKCNIFPDKIMAKYVHENVIISDKIVKLYKKNIGKDNDIFNLFDKDENEINVFKSSNQDNISTLIFFNIVKDHDNEKTLESFFRTICFRMDIANLIFRLREQQNFFKIQGGEIAHSFKIPLQALLFDLNIFQNIFKDDPELIGELKKTKVKIIEAKEDINVMLKASVLKREEIKISTIINDVISNLSYFANKQNCELIKEYNNELIINKFVALAYKSNIKIALTNIIHNAIKYSQKGTPSKGITNKIFINIDEQKDNELEFFCKIKNHGAECPQEIINNINEPGHRATIIDPKKANLREGTGWGLFIAKKYIEEDNGTITIESKNSDNIEFKSSWNTKTEDRLSFTTTIKISLPLVKK